MKQETIAKKSIFSENFPSKFNLVARYKIKFIQKNFLKNIEFLLANLFIKLS
jgi:hypothetical protein